MEENTTINFDEFEFYESLDIDHFMQGNVVEALFDDCLGYG
jgi:hypothetical protein